MNNNSQIRALVLVAGILASPLLNGGCLYCSCMETTVKASSMTGEEVKEMEGVTVRKSFSLKKQQPEILEKFAFLFRNIDWNYRPFHSSFFGFSAWITVFGSELSINAP